MFAADILAYQEIAISAREHRQRAKMAGPFFVTAYGSDPILSNLPETRKVADFEHVLHHTPEQVRQNNHRMV
jgi:hypothetical protein